MSLLQNNKRYIRNSQSTVTENVPAIAVPTKPATLIDVLEAEEYDLQGDLNRIEEAKSRERDLRLRLNVVQQSLQAFRALEAAPPPMQEQQVECQEKRIRKAATKKTDKPTARSIAPEPTVSDTENIALVHDDFATFPE